MGYPGENRRLSEDTVSTLERHHAFLQQFRAELAGPLKHEKATGSLSRRSKSENWLLSKTIELLNNGVSKVSEIGQDERQIKTLRFELETFVCDGEYARG